jgi:membrane protease YdiL (CAAX protease family)
MFERFKNRNRTVEDRDRGAVATEADARDRPVGDNGTVVDDTARPRNGRARATTGVATAETMSTVRARQREEFGGINWGAAFFGWLVAVGVAVLLTGILAAAGAAIGLTQPSTAAQAQSNPETLTLFGAIALLVVLALAYYCGGYVAGRMSRFDGARQGIGSWIIGLLVTIAAAVLAIIAGDRYNVVEQANLPRLPVGEETLTTGGAVATVVIVLGTLLFAVLGGIAGARYHRRVDRAGFVD